MLFKGGVVFSTTKRLRFANQPNKRGDKWESRGVGQENVVLFVGAESGSVLVFVEVKLLVGFGFCKSLKVGILYRTYEKVSRPGPCNFNGAPNIISHMTSSADGEIPLSVRVLFLLRDGL